jgi:Zn-finger protein
MKNSSRFFENNECEYFPCHSLDGDFNCMFCYCPLNSMENCPGNPNYIEVGGRRIKDCSDCTYPHKPENYDNIMNILKNCK